MFLIFNYQNNVDMLKMNIKICHFFKYFIKIKDY